jgi:hypothetical protein
MFARSSQDGISVTVSASCHPRDLQKSKARLRNSRRCYELIAQQVELVAAAFDPGCINHLISAKPVRPSHSLSGDARKWLLS